MAVPESDKDRIFRQFKHSLGAPIRDIELLDEQLCTFLEISTEDYAMRVQNWLIEHQWQSVLGKNIDTTDMAFALSVRDFDSTTQYSYAYSKQVGLQARGPWELKKDFIEVEAGRQVYQIPAGREINEVLWITPSSTDAALFANYGGFDAGYGGGFAQMGIGAGANGASGAGAGGGYYVAPAYDVLLTASDFNLKNRLLRSELIYKITAGPDGTRLLHLISTPGSKLSFGGAGVGGGAGGGAGPTSVGLQGCKVWYHYYDTGTDPDKIKECRKLNPDVITIPNEVPLAKLEFSEFNEPTKVLIRQLFMTEAKRALGRTRGKFGGVVGPPEAERTMDYETLVSEANDEKRQILEELDGRLERLRSDKQLERAANEAENLNKHLKYRPLGFYLK
mgnify:CR=1 FL=1|tara:strand:- start:4182 stop:5357 length:1176 start_codon:yes stop_codon:yes gene_type:complete